MRLIDAVAYSLVAGVLLAASASPARAQQLRPAGATYVSAGDSPAPSETPPVYSPATGRRKAAQFFGSWVAAASLGAIAFGEQKYRTAADGRRGGPLYSSGRNTAYTIGSFAGATSAAFYIGRGDGSRSPLWRTALGAALGTIPLLFAHDEPELMEIGTLLVTPLQGAGATIAYQTGRIGRAR